MLLLLFPGLLGVSTAPNLVI